MQRPPAAASFRRFELTGAVPGRLVHAIRGGPDHNSAEHALWRGRRLLGQWVFDVQCLLDWMAQQPGLDQRRFAVVGLGQAGIVAVCAAGLLDDDPGVEVGSVGQKAHRQRALKAIGALRLAFQLMAANVCANFARGLPAARPRLTGRIGAALLELWRINPLQADARAGELK